MPDWMSTTKMDHKKNLSKLLLWVFFKNEIDFWIEMKYIGKLIENPINSALISD